MLQDTSKITSLNLLTKTTNELANEILRVELDDPRRGPFLEELSILARLRHLLRVGSGQSVCQGMDGLLGEMAMLKPGDARRAQIVQEIILTWTQDPDEI